MEDVFVWEFWFSNNSDNKRVWYIEKVNWEYKLVIEKAFLEKNNQSWKIEPKFSENQEWIIHGKLINKNDIISWYKYVSLVWLSIFDFGFNIKEYNFKYLIFWFHFENEKSINFNSFEFTFDWLSEFIWEWSFNLIPEWNFLSPEKVNINIKKDNVIIEIWEYKWLNLSFINRWKQKTSNKNYTVRDKNYRLLNKVAFNNNYFFKINTRSNDINLDFIENFIINIQRLFSLIFKEDIKINEISIKKEIFFSEKQIEIMKTEKKSYISDIEIIFNQWYIAKNNKSEKKIKDREMLFHYSEVKILEIISNFINNSEDKFKTIYNLYYATLQNKNLHLENQFLNLIQAIEWIFWKAPIEVEIKWKKHFINTCSNTKKEEIDKKYNLISKFTLIEKYLWINFILKWENIKDNIKNIRNCFSHWWDREDFINLDLYKITILLKNVLELFILKELWLDDKLYSSIKSYKI